jgi:hypothetical protein
MREFEFVFDKALVTGLRRDSSQPTNEQALSELYNAKAGPLGVMAYNPVVPPSGYVVTPDWPFPQYFRGMSMDLFGERRRMWEGVTKVIFEGQVGDDDDIWDVADYHKYFMACKGSGNVWRRHPTDGHWMMNPPMPRARTVCNYNGQLMIANLSPFGDWTDVSDSHIAWSEIGSAEFALTRKNTSGYRRSEYDMEVLRVLPLLDSVMAYGYDGIGSLRPVTTPAPTFGYVTVSDFGIQGKGAVGGTKKEHLFLSSDGYLYKMSPGKPAPEFIGYDEYMKPLLNDIVMITAVGNGDFYISNGTKGYLLSPYGLSEVYQRVTSASFQLGQPIGVSDDSGDLEFRLTTGTIDFGLRARKTTEVVEIGHEGAGLEAAIDWRMDSTQPFVRSGWKALNLQGIAHLRQSGVEFRVALRAADYTGIKINYIKLRYKMDDMRSIRGVYAPPPRGQGPSLATE